MQIKIYFFNLFFYFSVIFFGLLFLPVLISRNLTRKIVGLWAKLIIFFLEITLNIKVVFKNKYLKNHEGQVIAANHQSAFDTIFLAHLIKLYI